MSGDCRGATGKVSAGPAGTPVVAVVGGGASGTLTAAQLARQATGLGRTIRLLLVEPEEPGRGVAYATTDHRHRLNVPARAMSAWPDDPGHFLRWLRAHVDADFPETGYAPRVHYREYLQEVLAESLQAAPLVDFHHLRTRATDLRPQGRRLRLVLADRTSRPIDAVVLATGYGAPATGWAPAALRASGRFVADPWAPGVRPELPAGREILLVGTGLTMVDQAMTWTRAGIRTHVVSRHGLLPLAHAAEPAPPVAPGELPPAPIDLQSANHYVLEHIRRVGDWRAAVDGLRPVTQRLWGRMTDEARAGFLRTSMRRWDQVRHRVDPQVGAWLADRQADGSLVPHTGTILAARAAAGGVDVELSDGTILRAAMVVNCTGASTDLRRSDDPLLMNLLATGLVTPEPGGLGVSTTDGRLGSATAWVVGPLRKGELWESIAVPELRQQADTVAGAVLAALPHRRLVRRPRDSYGLPLSASDEAADAYVAALGRILRVQSGAERLVEAAVTADPGFALGHAVHALLGVEWGVPVDSEAALRRAEQAIHRADEREQRFVEVAQARVRTPGPAASAALLAYLSSYPEDALAVSLAVPTIAFGGATELPAEAWALVEGLAPVYGNDWWYQGLLAFIRQEQERFDEAAQLATATLSVEPAAGHAVHAKAHVHHETGDHRAGLAWLDRWIATCGATASHRAHFSWHAAMHELSLGDADAVRRRYRDQLAPPTVTGVRALVDSASLLWRASLAGMAGVGDVATVLESVPPELIEEPPTPFVALHAAVALAAVGDCGRLSRLRRATEGRVSPVFTETVAPLADGLVDLVHGNPSRAADRLIALTGVDRLGGSAAQQAVVEDTLLHCLVEAGRTDEACDLLDRRLRRRPCPRETLERAALT